MQFNDQISRVKAIADRLKAEGASHCMLVGGFVRDYLMGNVSQDIDVEVYGLGYDQIVRALAPHHRVDLVGLSFGVVKVDNEIDISIPRRDLKVGVGHRDFAVRADLTMTPREAAHRRDFTINSMGMHFDGSFFDPFGGQRDLQRGVLRATSQAFREDPLRVLRGMQFAARFGFSMDDDTIAICRDIVGDFQHLSQERVWDEWYKWATQGKFPSIGLRLLADTGWIANFPIMKAMMSTPQDPEWHPEGDVFVHTCHVCDAAARIADREDYDAKQRAILLIAALCHDFGKTTTTARNAEGRWIAREHAEVGMPQTERFLAEMQAPHWVIGSVVPLVGGHMAHVGHPKQQPPSPRVVRRLACRLAPATIRMWSSVCEADASGRPPKPAENPVARWVSVADELAIQEDQPRPVLMGRHLLSKGYEPGPGMGVILGAAFEAQLDGEFADVAEALEWVQDRYPPARD